MGFNIFYDNLIIIPSIAFVVTVFLKWLFIKISTWKIDLEKSLGTWWMPSVHSAVVVSLATAVAIKYWIWDDLFAVTMAFTLIIIYDAINIRFEAGQHATEINKTLWEKKYKESLWHLPSEAFAGSIVWILVAVILSLF